MKRTKLLSLSMLTIMLVCSCVHIRTGIKHETEVKTVKQLTKINPFDEVEIAGPMSVIFEQNGTYTVRVETSPETFDKLVIYVQNKQLHIDTKDNVSIDDEVKVYITSPSLAGIDLAGSGTFDAPQPLAVRELDLDLAGSGDIHVKQLTCSELSIDLAGSGNMNFEQVEAQRVETDIAGSGNVKFSNLQADRAESSISGSGNIVMSGSVRHHVENISGSGQVDTSGLK